MPDRASLLTPQNMDWRLCARGWLLVAVGWWLASATLALAGAVVLIGRTDLLPLVDSPTLRILTDLACLLVLAGVGLHIRSGAWSRLMLAAAIMLLAGALAIDSAQAWWSQIYQSLVGGWRVDWFYVAYRALHLVFVLAACRLLKRQLRQIGSRALGIAAIITALAFCLFRALDIGADVLLAGGYFNPYAGESPGSLPLRMSALARPMEVLLWLGLPILITLAARALRRLARMEKNMGERVSLLQPDANALRACAWGWVLIAIGSFCEWIPLHLFWLLFFVRREVVFGGPFETYVFLSAPLWILAGLMCQCRCYRGGHLLVAAYAGYGLMYLYDAVFMYIMDQSLVGGRHGIFRKGIEYLLPLTFIGLALRAITGIPTIVRPHTSVLVPLSITIMAILTPLQIGTLYFFDYPGGSSWRRYSEVEHSFAIIAGLVFACLSLCHARDISAAASQENHNA